MFSFLIIEGNHGLDSQLKCYLKKECHEITSINSQEDYYSYINTKSIDMVIISTENQDFDYNKIILDIRQQCLIPIIVISSIKDITEKILCLDMGANDYIVRPYNPLESISRINSLLFWYKAITKKEHKPDNSYSTIKIGELVLNIDTKKAYREGVEIELTPIGFKILHLLMSNPNKVFSIDQIYKSVWDEDSFSSNNTVSVHLRRLRKKIEVNPSKPEYIKSVWGLGYKLSIC